MGERPRVDFDLGEAERRIVGMANVGTIDQTDYERVRFRVRIGDLITDWLPMLTPRAQGDRTWHPPEQGEQVMVLAQHGDLAQGVVIGAINRNAQPAPADRPSVDRVVYADGAVVEYDRAAGQYTVDLTEPGGTIVLRTGRTTVTIAPDQVIVDTPFMDVRQA